MSCYSDFCLGVFAKTQKEEQRPRTYTPEFYSLLGVLYERPKTKYFIKTVYSKYCLLLCVFFVLAAAPLQPFCYPLPRSIAPHEREGTEKRVFCDIWIFREGDQRYCRHSMTLVGLNSGLASPMKQRLRKKDLVVYATTARATQLLCLTTENVTIDNLV